MYSVNQYVRVEGTNTLKVITEIVNVGDKNFYICDDNVWYDESLIYPHDMKIQLKESMGEKLSLSDFGDVNEVLSDLSDYINTPECIKKLNDFFESGGLDRIECDFSQVDL